ncbi:MAG: helix-turn-helix domain-containing protein [Sphaerochaetaceae bacterium]|nr:helix-turn-helix domain-containing protein [Sphaerochaetaceae bacterium]
MEQNRYSKISNYLKKLSSYFDATICIKDFSGFISQNQDFHTALSPFLIHDKPYCKYLKSDSTAMMHCQSQIPYIIKKSHEKRCSFYGTCHAGMWELVVPIIQNNHIIGAILFGCYKEENIDEKKNYIRVSKRFENLKIEKLEKLYQLTSKVPKENDIDLIQSSLEVIANEIVLLQEDNYIDSSIHKKEDNSPYDSMVMNAIDYMKSHMKEKISLNDIASYCNYSPSYLSHHFKKIVGVNINVYINKMKVEHSKNHLLKTDDTLSTIAEELGFSDVSYYSRIFTKICGISPGKFREKYIRVVKNERL